MLFRLLETCPLIVSIQHSVMICKSQWHLAEAATRGAL